MSDRLDRQLAFLIEADQLKSVGRRTSLADGSRPENSAEHSWHVALFALTLAEYALEAVDLARVVAMLVVHDLVEIDAGDTFVYDQDAAATKAAREEAAAARVFGLLPHPQGDRLRALWEEFEARATAEARFAAALDRLAPVLLNRETHGRSWRTNGIAAARVREVNAVVGEAAPELGRVVRDVVDEAVAAGWIAER